MSHHYLGPGQSGHVKDDVAAEVLGSVCHSISQDQAALSVSVVDLHRLTATLQDSVKSVVRSLSHLYMVWTSSGLVARGPTEFSARQRIQ